MKYLLTYITLCISLIGWSQNYNSPTKVKDKKESKAAERTTESLEATGADQSIAPVEDFSTRVEKPGAYRYKSNQWEQVVQAQPSSAEAWHNYYFAVKYAALTPNFQECGF